MFSDSDSDSDHSVGLPPPIKVDFIVKDTSGEGQDIEVGIEEVNITKETDLVKSIIDEIEMVEEKSDEVQIE